MTKREREVMAFIRDRLDRIGVAPNLQEIGERFDFTKARACVIVNAIVEQGLLEREHRGTSGLRLPGHVDLTGIGTEQLRAELARRGVTLDALAEPQALFNEGKACAANHCRERVKQGQLFCRPHWFKLPRDYQCDITRAWARRHSEAFQEALERARNFLGGYTLVAERVA